MPHTFIKESTIYAKQIYSTVLRSTDPGDYLFFFWFFFCQNIYLGFTKVFTSERNMRVLSAFTVLLMLDSSHSCVTDLDCSLNGKCTSASRVSSASSSASSERTLSNRTTSAASTTNTCVCTKPWYGPSCATVRFKPVTFPQGYVITNAFYILFQQQPLLAYLGGFFLQLLPPEVYTRY